MRLRVCTAIPPQVSLPVAVPHLSVNFLGVHRSWARVEGWERVPFVKRVCLRPAPVKPGVVVVFISGVGTGGLGKRRKKGRFPRGSRQEDKYMSELREAGPEGHA